MTSELQHKKSREEILARIGELDSLIQKEMAVVHTKNKSTSTEATHDDNHKKSTLTSMSTTNPLDTQPIAPTRTTSSPTQSLEEQLDEIENNARESIKENANTTADEALKGNKEEIDALTLRINQYNSIKEGVANLKEKRDSIVNNPDQSFDQTLVDQIDEQINTLENLSPYKSQEKDGTESQNTESNPLPDQETPQEKKNTVNESFARDEKNLNDTFNPREKSVAEAYEDGTLKQNETPDSKEIPENENSSENEIPKSPELLALEDARKKYAEKQKQFLDNHRKTQSSINKIRDFFGFGKKIKEEQLPEELKELKSLYSEKKVSYGKSLIEEQIKIIEKKVQNNELTEEEQSETLEMFMKGELFDEIIVKERESFVALQAETLPAKEKGIFNKALDGYLKLKPWQRTVISSALITGAIATTGAFASAGVAGTYLGTKIAKGVASVYVGKKIGAGVDSILKKEFDRNLTRIDRDARYDITDFSLENFDRALSYAEKSHERKLKLEQDTKRVRLVTKGVISLIAGLGTSDVIGRGIIPNISHISQSVGIDATTHSPEPKITPDTIKADQSAPIKTIPADSIKPISDTINTTPPPNAIKIDGGSSDIELTDTTSTNSPVTENLNDSVITPKDSTLADAPSQPKISTPDTAPTPEPQITPKLEAVSVDADKLGAIETFKDLKAKLIASYPDPKLAPANVREILEGDPTSLAIKYGLYNPSQGAESAALLKGEQLGIDTKGNLYFKDVNGTVDYLSQNKGFDGKMIDTDNSNTLPKTSQPQDIPKSIDPNENSTSSQQSEIIKSVDPNDSDINTKSEIIKSINPYDGTEIKNPSLIKSIDPNEYGGFRQNTFYSQDPEMDAMTPQSEQMPVIKNEVFNNKEIVSSVDTQGIHALAEQQFNKDIDSMFQKPNFLLGGSTPGTKTEEWARTLRFIEENKVTGNHIFEAIDSQALQNSQQGEFFTLGEYAKSLRMETGLSPNDGELLKDYLIRAQEYKIKNHITDKEMIKLIDETDGDKKIKISDETRQKIRARRSVDSDGVYN